MAANLTTVKKQVTEILNAHTAGSYDAAIDSNNKDRIAAHITDACADAALLIARAILANPNHVHRNVFVPASAVELTHQGELPDMAGENDLVEIQHYAGEVYRVGVPRPVQEVTDLRLNTSLLSSVYGAKAHNAQNTPIAGFYSMSRGRFYFTGNQARGYFPVINRASTLGTAGVAQVETSAVDAACSSDGNMTVTVTADGMPGSPKSVTIGLSTLLHTSAANVASQIANDLNDFSTSGDIADWFTFTTSTSPDVVIMTANAARANDTTMNLAFSFAGTGPSNVTTSTNTTAGTAPDVATLIPDEYESTWVALAVGFTIKEGDNLFPIAQYYMAHGMNDLQAITQMSLTAPLPPVERAMNARGDV